MVFQPLIIVTTVGKLCPKPRTNHEISKRRKHEKRIRGVLKATYSTRDGEGPFKNLLINCKIALSGVSIQVPV